MKRMTYKQCIGKQEKVIMKLLSIFINKKLCSNIIHLEKVKFTFKCSNLNNDLRVWNT